MSTSHPAHVGTRDAPDGSFRDQLQRVVADRHSPEAAALYKALFDYALRRVRRPASAARLSDAEREEVVGDVLLYLMNGGLASFRGASAPELFAFVRTITDRAVWRVVRSRERERQALDEAGEAGSAQWSAPPPIGADAVEVVGESPLSDGDQRYLVDLLRAGSKAELARRSGVSRAAVTQRVQRIVERLGALEPGQRVAHEVWLAQAASTAAAGD